MSMNGVHDPDVQNAARAFPRRAVSLAHRYGAWLVFLAVLAIQNRRMVGIIGALRFMRA